MNTAAQRRAYTGPALFSFGFRPFFLFGAVWSALVVPIWLTVFMHGGPGAITLEWHVHEMLFGFLGAVLAGFLTTAVPNWTGRMPVIGAPLAGLVALWLAGRIAMLFPGPAAAAIDSLFLLAFAAVIWREVLTGRNWRNLPVCLLVTLFALGNVVFHLGGASGFAVGERVALAAAAALISLIGGRITPSFTRNWLRSRGDPAAPAAPDRIDQVALALTFAGACLWAIAPEQAVSGWILIAAGAANLVRLARWRGWRTLAEPLVAVLHVAYAWLGAALVLLGASVVSPVAPRTAGIHALTAGAIGVATLAVMTRATRGHTGRPLTADAATRLIYLAVNLAAVCRVAAPFVASAQVVLLSASAVFWCLAFGGFAATYSPMLTTPRPARA